MSAVLVTGGAGYVGSHAVKALRGAGYDVVVYDDLSAGHREAALGSPLVEGDIHDVATLGDTLRAHRVEAVLHFAAWASVGESVSDPRGYYWNNVGGTLAVLEAMVGASVERFVFSSSAAVFGEPLETPIDETHPTRPINPYGETKLAIERALPYFERAYRIRSVSLRYFNAAGADPDGEIGEDHDPEPHLIPRAIAAAAGGEPVPVFGEDYPTPDGTCLRDYVHVTDLADAHVRALAALEAGAPTTAYNLGNGRPISVREVLMSVGRVTGRTVPFARSPGRPGDPSVLCASSALIERELGWRPALGDLDTMVETAWRWHTSRSRLAPEGAR